MSEPNEQEQIVELPEPIAPGLFSLLGKYRGIIFALVILTIIANALSISIPKIISGAIDSYSGGHFLVKNLIVEFSLIALLIFIFTYLQNVVQVYASERVARDLRNDIIARISVQPYAYIEAITPAKILTNLTSDVDSVKIFVSMAVSSIISSVFLIIGVSVLLLITDWKLALAVLAVMPFIGLTFFLFCEKFANFLPDRRRRLTGSTKSSAKAFSVRL